MVVVAGRIHVDVDEREAYLAGCVSVVSAARSADGCVDFSICADIVDPTRINVFEKWESVEAVEAFRGSGTPGDQQAQIRDAEVFQYEVTSSTQL